MITIRLWAAARNFASLSSVVLCAWLIALPVAAQDATTQQNPQSQDQQPVARPIPQRTVGLEPGKVVRWTLRDAIVTALEKNVDIELERENVRLMQYDLIAAQGFYDPTVTSSILYNKSAFPTSSRFTGADSNSITRDTVTYNAGLVKNIERYGGRLDANFNNQRLASNTNNLEVQYSPSLTFQFTQPLFRDYRIDANRRLIRVTKKRLDLTDAQFRQRVIEIISTVQQAYWDLALAIRNEEIARDSVQLAETQLNNNKRQVEVGTLAPIDVVSAATSLESRRQQVFIAINSVAQAENAIKNLTVGGPNDDLWNAQIIPVESFDIKPVMIPLADAVKLAQDNRPEIKQLGLQKEMNTIDVDFYRNQAKPQIDFVAGYTTNGLAGAPATITSTSANCASPVPSETDPTKLFCLPIVVRTDASGNNIPVLLPPVPFVRTTTTGLSPITDQFIGGYGTALGNLFKNEFRTWSVGVQINFPLRNRTAKANLGKALEQDRQLDMQTRRQLQNIEVEVRNAVQSVETAKMRIDAAKLAREYAEKQLEGEEKKFQAGLSATFFVLQRQNDLSVARFDELRALADYNKSVATLQRVLSTTLSSNSIEIPTDTPVTIK
jgi:HAE1 family hydrophobic/amphiphilic exporter-1